MKQMNQYAGRFTIFMAGSILTVLLLSQTAFNERNETVSLKKEIVSLPVIPEKLEFAGEHVPLERWEVKELMDRELVFIFYNKASVLHTLRLANRYFPMISARLAANGVPDDFKYMCVAESNLEANARSKAGAISFWQFMDNTAPGYQLTVNEQVDQRYDLERSTDAACRYIKDAYRRFGNWTAAAASYNCGMGRYNGQAGFQRSNHFYDLYLPEETNRYIFRILAFKHLMSNAQELGFDVNEQEKYKPVPARLVEVKNSIPDLAAFAIQNGTTYKMLKLMNPWIKGRSLTVTPNRGIVLKLPA